MGVYFWRLMLQRMCGCWNDSHGRVRACVRQTVHLVHDTIGLNDDMT